jgi:hypothetical protein
MPEYRIKLIAANSAAVIALGVVVSIITSTVVASNAYRSKYAEAQKAHQSIVVKGKATQKVESDQGFWSVTVKGVGKTIKEAHKVLEDGVTKVDTFLYANYFAQQEVNHGAISTTVYYDRDEEGNTTRDVVEYELSQPIKISTFNVKQIARAAGDVTDLLQDGVHVIGGVPRYTYSRVSDVKVAILADAAANARTRAEEIAKQAGSRVNHVKAIRQGVIQITTPNSTRVSSYGINDTSTINKDVSVVVTVTFGIGG